MSACFPRALGLYVRRGRCPVQPRELPPQGERPRPRTRCGVEERRPLTRDMAARGRTSSAACDVSGCRWPVRRVWFTSLHTGRCTSPLPRRPPSAPGLCRRAASRTLPSSAMSGRDARRGPPGRCLRTALPRQAEGTGQKRTEHGPLEGALAARGETGAGVSRETHVLHHESAEERPETE